MESDLSSVGVEVCLPVPGINVPTPWWHTASKQDVTKMVTAGVLSVSYPVLCVSV